MKLILCGGGWGKKTIIPNKAFEGIIDPSKPILYIPVAREKRAPAYQDCTEWLLNEFSGITHGPIDTIESTDSIANIDLSAYTAIFIGGGNTYKLLKELKDSGAMQDIINYINKNLLKGVNDGDPSLVNVIFSGYCKYGINYLVKNFNTIIDVKRVSWISALKQICNHPYQFLKSGEMGREMSGKMEKCIDLVQSILDNGEKTLIFTQYKEMGDILCKVIGQECNTEPLFFHGSLTVPQREELIERFQTSDDCKVMILSLKAGGTGLNLTGADYVIHYDPWWNPAVEDQATDRAYRIGQKNNVQVYKMITKDSIEEKIYELQRKKEAFHTVMFRLRKYSPAI